MTNELSGYLDTAIGVVRQIEQLPVAIAIVVVLVLAGSSLKALALFPNKLIPVAVLALGGIANAFLGNPGSVSPDYRFPEAGLALQGIILGFGAWVLHGLVLKRFEKRIPFLAGKSGDTTPPFKPE